MEERKVNLTYGNYFRIKDLPPDAIIKIDRPKMYIPFFITFQNNPDLIWASKQLVPTGRAVLDVLTNKMHRKTGNKVKASVIDISAWTGMDIGTVYKGVGYLRKLGYIRKGGVKFEVILNPYWFWCGPIESVLESRKEWDLLAGGLTHD